MTPPHAETDHDPRYRRNVGIVVFNAAGQVWLGRRHGFVPPHNWQFPQGGVDEGEDLMTAAKRELQEESGIVTARFLARAPGWMTYDFPPEIVGTRGRGYLGQAQSWFAFRFEGAESEIDLHAHTHPEFDAWRWAGLDEALELVVPFKRKTYEAVVEAFRTLIPSPLAGEGGAQP